MEYKEDDFLMLSGIQHFKFCRRQWALIHIEQQWAENVHTVVGELMHQKAHDPMITEKRKDVLITRALSVSSRSMGISGVCDVVEFHRCEDGVSLYGHRGFYEIFPIEYKKGKPKTTEEDILQLTAQAMCLEEMFSAQISKGAIFYGETRKREEITFTEELRRKCGKCLRRCTGIMSAAIHRVCGGAKAVMPVLSKISVCRRWERQTL